MGYEHLSIMNLNMLIVCCLSILVQSENTWYFEVANWDS